MENKVPKYTATVLWNGDHYHHGEIVRGSKIKQEDGKVWLYDDEEQYLPEIGDPTRCDWVEVDPKSLSTTESSYTVKVTEVLIREVNVFAGTPDGAITLVKAMYDNEKIVLGAEDLDGPTTFEAV